MVKKIISLGLLGISLFLCIKHGIEAFYPITPEHAERRAALGININQDNMLYFGIFSIIVGLMLLFRKTFIIANLLSVIPVVIVMAMAIKTSNYAIVLVEIPFLAMPFIMIWLKYPLTNLFGKKEMNAE
ncbi:hypothetical protein [Nonlabens ulvanivorans]|uniref:hypothetical protein n=1 Tax=Nonlabens ulvanivorans TaxID=906888 RepID=UPI0032646006